MEAHLCGRVFGLGNQLVRVILHLVILHLVILHLVMPSSLSWARLPPSTQSRANGSVSFLSLSQSPFSTDHRILDNRWHWQEFMLYLGFAFALAGGVVAIVFVVEFFRFLPTLCSSDDSQMMPQYTPGGQPQQQNYNSNQACQPNTTINLTAPTAPQYVSQQQPQMYPPPQQPYTQAYPQPQPPGYKQQPQMQSQEPVVGMPAATSNPTTPTYTLSNVYNK